ncbi:MAP/microtubule affinity-regulating kinase 3 [Irineochytrium annulatum]|nr:MAP/microtubule affinity-regulating kinase 3 [Irineochytrium annulatum]
MSTAKPSSKRRDKDDTTNPDVHLASIGNYHFQKTVGEGNFAKVKLAKHKLTGAEVAIKVIDKTTLDEKKLGKLYREVRIMKMLHHPHIVKLYEVIETKHTVFLVMEYASGGELYDYLVVHGKMKEKEARAKFRQILSAVSYCHKKRVIHRDLKAENLLLDSNLDIKIADFGFSNYFDPDSKLDTFCGSPPYAAPELFQGRRYTGPEVDIWSLGVILYVLTTGCLPFDGKNLQEMRESVCRGKYRIPFYLSDACEKLLRKFLIRDPSKRAGLDILVDDAWINEGYSDSPISSDLSSKGVEEDEAILRLMESKYHVDRSLVLHALRENIYDDISATYLLLYFDKEARSHVTAEVEGKKQLSIATQAHTHVSSAGESQSAAAALPPQIQRSHPEAAKVDGEEGGAGAAADGDMMPNLNLRPQTVRAKPRKRRFTVGGEADVAKLADEDEEAAELLKKLQHQAPLIEDATSAHAVGQPSGLAGVLATSPVIVTPSLQGPPTPMGRTPMPVAHQNQTPREIDEDELQEVADGMPGQLAGDSASEVQHPGSAGGSNNAAGTSSPAGGATQPRKRHNTIVGILRSHMRRQSDVSGMAPMATLQDQQANRMDAMGSSDENAVQGAVPGAADATGDAAKAGGVGGNSDAQGASDDGFGPNGAHKPRSLRFTFNSNTTSSKPPDDIIAQVVAACDFHGIQHRLASRFLVECYWGGVGGSSGGGFGGASAGNQAATYESGQAAGSSATVGGAGSGVKLEIEVCKLPRLKNLHGLRFKRVGGSSADYKEVCERILGSLAL